jgi:hypothetical protein
MSREVQDLDDGHWLAIPFQAGPSHNDAAFKGAERAFQKCFASNAKLLHSINARINLRNLFSALGYQRISACALGSLEVRNRGFDV